MQTITQLQDPDQFMAQQQAPAPQDPDEFMAQKARPARLPDPDEFMQERSAPAPTATPAATPAAAPPATPPQPKMKMVAGPRGIGTRLVPDLSLGEAIQQTKEDLSKPLIPLSQITAPYMAPNPEDRPPTPIMSTGGMFARPIQRTAGPEEQQPTVLHGVLKAAEGMTSPVGLGMMAAIGPLTSPSLEFMGFLNSIALAGDTGYKAIKAYQMANKLDAQGHPVEATVARTEAITNAAMGLGFIYHGVKGAAGAGNAYAGAIDNIRAGLNSPHLDAESLGYIRSVVEKADIEPADKTHLLAVADARAEQMAKQAPPVAGVPPQVEAPAPGTIATGPFPGPQQGPTPTVRAQLRVPGQAPLPATEAAGPTQPLAALPEWALRTGPTQVVRPRTPEPEPLAAPPPAWEQTVTQPKPATEPTLPIYGKPPATEPLPGLNMPRAAVDPNAPMLDIQRRTVFAIADSKGVPKEGMEALAGKQISTLTRGEARVLMDKLNGLTPEEAQALRPQATTPLLDQVNAAQAGEAEAPTNTVVFGKQRKAPQYDPDVSLVNAIRYLGGIDPDKIRKSGLWTEWTERVPQGIRLALQRKGAAHGLDTVGAELAHLGYQGYDVADSIVEALHDPKIANAGMRDIAEANELEQANAYIAELEGRLKQTEFNPDELATAGEEPGRVIREPGEEGFARHRDDRTKDLFAPEEFALTGGVGRRAELPEQRPAAVMPTERPQQLAMEAGPLFEKAMEGPKLPTGQTIYRAGAIPSKEPWEYGEGVTYFGGSEKVSGNYGTKVESYKVPANAKLLPTLYDEALSGQEATDFAKKNGIAVHDGAKVYLPDGRVYRDTEVFRHVQTLGYDGIAEGSSREKLTAGDFSDANIMVGNKLAETMARGQAESTRPAPQPGPKQEAKPTAAVPERAAPAAIFGPFTQLDIDRFNRLTQFPKDLANENARFAAETAQERQAAIDRLKRYGIDEVPPDVEAALLRLRTARLNMEKEFTRAREAAPPWTVTGRSNYQGNPERARAIEQKAVSGYDAAKEYLESALKRRSPSAPISADKAEAPDLLQDRIVKAEKLQETMRQANAIVRKKGLTDEQRVEQIAALGMSKGAAAEVLKPDFAGRTGFADYQLQNNLANIKRMRARVEEIGKTRSVETSETRFEGGRILDNAEANRVQLFFDQKPDAATIAKLKANGFKWAPSEGAWQRQRTANARYATTTILGDRMPEGSRGAFLGTRGTAPEEPTAEELSPLEQIGKSAAKEPWQMTQEEYAESKGVLKSWEALRQEAEQTGGTIRATYGIDSAFGKKGDPISISFDSSDYWSKPVVTNERTSKSVRVMNALPYQVLTTEHQGFVRDALSEGKAVPPEVLKNYPDLQPEYIDAEARSTVEGLGQQAEKVEPVRPVSEAAGQFAQMEVDRRATVARETIERVVKGEGTWIEKRKQLDLPTGRGYYGDQFRDVPIGKSEIDAAVKREMAETSKLTGLTPTEAQKPQTLARPQTRSLFGDDVGFLRFRNRPLIDDDPQMKQIFDRLEQAEKNARRPPLDILPRPGEADVPNSGAHRVSWVRSADQALARYEDTAPVAREIKTAARDKKRAMQYYDDIASDIVKESKIKKGSEEDRMVKDLLDESYTGLTPEKLRDSVAYQGNKEAAIKAAGRLRNEIFDPIINQIRGDPELSDIIGKRGYIRGYFPHYEQMMKAKYGPDYMGMVRALLPERFMSAFLKERTGNKWANDVSIHDVIPAYINSTMKTIHDIPAYNRALEVIKGLPEGPARGFAQWYADNYMGQRSAREGFMVNNAPYQAFSRWVAQRYYDNLIGLNPNTWLKQLGKTMINTYPELGGKYTWEGIKGMFDPMQRQQFHASGLLFDHPGMEAGILKEGMRRSILHGGTAAAQYVDRGIAYLGGLAQAKDMGLVGRAAEMHAMDVTDKVAFAYGKESGIRAIQNLPPDWRVFQTWPAKEFEFVRNLVSDAISGGKPERARLTRFLMVNVGIPAALTAAGVPTGKVFVDIFHILPRPFRSAQLMMRCYNWLQGVADGKVKAEDIPSDIVTGLWDAFGPAANIMKQISRAVSPSKPTVRVRQNE